LGGVTIAYHLGVDGTEHITTLANPLSRRPFRYYPPGLSVEERVKDFMVFFLLLEMGKVGVFQAYKIYSCF
jgi:NADH:ubiquinone oxidoreductase subunit 4 (subunit M)